MTEEPSKKRLGRGLAALIGEMDKPVSVPDTADASNQLVTDHHAPIESIVANPNNPRRLFEESELEDLANSISEHGIVQPILVRSKPDQTWEIIAGERRWRAAQKAGIHSVPIIVRNVDDRQSLELAIIENVQRTDLNPIEEAQGYQKLIDEHEYSQAELGKAIGKSRSHVANTLRLMKLPEKVIALVADGSLSSGHARALIPLTDPSELAERIVREGLSVRQVEQIAAEPAHASSSSRKDKPAKLKDADTKALEKHLSDAMGLRITINNKANNKGRMTIDYQSLEQLDSLLERLTS